MRTVFEFRVDPRLPEPLRRLEPLAYNIWWSWHGDARELFQRVDPRLWEETAHNPVQVLARVAPSQLDKLARDTSFLDQLDRVHRSFTRYLEDDRTWYATHHPGPEGAARTAPAGAPKRAGADPFVAYFSMEYGLTECLKVYSGGLGVLSGDHIKSASDLGIPLAGVGLLFQQGYFQQALDGDGWQGERYPVNDFWSLPIRQAVDGEGAPLTVEVAFPGRSVRVQVWRCEVGRTTLFLLDTNLPANRPDDQNITDQLYGGDQEMRIKQELILGVGGIRALRAVGSRPEVCHINEGHAAFLVIERVRELVQESSLPVGAARAAVKGGCVFTTHTPVPAGFDLFPTERLRPYLVHHAAALGVDPEYLLGMGRKDPDDASEPFNMALLAYGHAAHTNGVSRLHGQVTRKMSQAERSEMTVEDVPVHHVTNGVHLPTWVSTELKGLFNHYLGSGWAREPSDPESWAGLERIPDMELWRAHERLRNRLVGFARRRLRAQRVARGAAPADIMAADAALDPDALTVGFARRFATYKRATLLLSDAERIVRLLTSADRPVQIVFAGKAHPHDHGGKELIKQIVRFSRDPRIAGRVVFLENYDLEVGRNLVQGVDVWLNTPRRPLEASGTSGMKVAANGGLNLSVLDGWWAEGYTPQVGWAIGHGEEYTDVAYHDAVEAAALYDILEHQVIPLFYDRGRDGLPVGWIARMRAAIGQLAPFFNTTRMVAEYTDRFYVPARAHHQSLIADGFRGARELADWRVRVLRAWPKVRIDAVALPDAPKLLGAQAAGVGDAIAVTAEVSLGALTADDVTVEICTGPLDDHRQLTALETSAMTVSKALGAGRFQYSGTFPCQRAGRHGLAVRAYPTHPELSERFELSLIRWA